MFLFKALLVSFLLFHHSNIIYNQHSKFQFKSLAVNSCTFQIEVQQIATFFHGL